MNVQTLLLIYGSCFELCCLHTFLNAIFILMRVERFDGNALNDEQLPACLSLLLEPGFGQKPSTFLTWIIFLPVFPSQILFHLVYMFYFHHVKPFTAAATLIIQRDAHTIITTPGNWSSILFFITHYLLLLLPSLRRKAFWGAS